MVGKEAGWKYPWFNGSYQHHISTGAVGCLYTSSNKMKPVHFCQPIIWHCLIEIWRWHLQFNLVSTDYKIVVSFPKASSWDLGNLEFLMSLGRGCFQDGVLRGSFSLHVQRPVLVVACTSLRKVFQSDAAWWYNRPPCAAWYSLRWILVAGYEMDKPMAHVCKCCS